MTKQRGIFYVGAKDPQKDILQLQELETKWHEQAPSNQIDATVKNNLQDAESIPISAGTSSESLSGNGNSTE